MIDPVTIGAAFAVAKTSVAFVKEAIGVGHQIKDCYDDLSKFFKAQGQIEKAAKEAEIAKALPKPSDPKEAEEHESALSQAFTLVMHRKQMREFERELKDMFMMQGEMELYEELCVERNRIAGEQDKEARERLRKARLAKDIAERKKKEREDLFTIVGVITVVGIGMILVFSSIYYMR